eukprot:6608852-Prymnesium_polylepis.1
MGHNDVMVRFDTIAYDGRTAHDTTRPTMIVTYGRLERTGQGVGSGSLQRKQNWGGCLETLIVTYSLGLSGTCADSIA